MRDRNGRAISDGDLLSSCVWLVESQVTQVGCKMMSFPAIKNPVIWIVLLRHGHVSPWMPGSRSWCAVVLIGGSTL